MQVYHLTKADTGNILLMFSFGMIFGSPLLSFLSNRIFKGRKPVLMVSSFIMTLIMFSMVIYTDKIPLGLFYVLFFGIGVFSSSVVAVGFTTTKELFPVQIAGTSIGLINLFPFAGGAIFQTFIGYSLEKGGRVNDAFTLSSYRQAMMVLFVCSFLAFISSLFIKETLKNKMFNFSIQEAV